VTTPRSVGLTFRRLQIPSQTIRLADINQNVVLSDDADTFAFAGLSWLRLAGTTGNRLRG
jgi:hypothetical protein